MRAILTYSFILVAFFSFSQRDTLFESNSRKAADIIFQNLNNELYGPSLINRSLTDKSTTLAQADGDYSQIHNIYSFIELYEDLAIAYIDSTYMMNPSQLGAFLISKFEENDRDTTFGLFNLVQPFGLLIHNTKRIAPEYSDSTHFTAENFHLTPTIDESVLYQNNLFKSAALFEFDPENGAEIGYLKYESNLISVSPDISDLTIKLDVGNGFQLFDESNPLIEYSRATDSLIGKAGVQYRISDELVNDTILFYLTAKGNGIVPKSVERWDDQYPFIATNGTIFWVMFRQGCDNNYPTVFHALRRPIIIAPPYRPTIQPFLPNKYWDQFDYKSVMASLSDMGYDVFFLRITPGNPSLEAGGTALAEFIKDINVRKKNLFPNEDWENIVMGYSMGGQLSRYALLKMEKEHMEQGKPHHHTRLYIPFDSPHHGANIPLTTQAVYKSYSGYNLFAYLAYASLIDAASSDMSFYHINGGSTNTTSNAIYISPGAHIAGVGFQNAVKNNFLHTFSHPNDTRRSFPSFTRNITVSTGNANKNYATEYSLTPGKLLFEQNAINIGWLGLNYKTRAYHASKYGPNERILFDERIQYIPPFFWVTMYRNDFRTQYGVELDMAQGGYKDEFYDKPGTGGVFILQWTGNFFFGNKYYSNHMSFLPTFSALALNSSIWQNNNLFYDLKGNDLMYKLSSDINSQNYSNTYGYPNLGRPTDHFNITPFEAIYCDPQTYEHIKMQQSIDDHQSYDDSYLVYLRNFILDEVEADIVCLQNQTIGKNHIQLSAYKYRAWYKAYDQIWIGNLVTPKTDAGDYIIENTGDITVKAQNSISIQSGFHAQAGSDFHAFIGYDGCSRPRVE